MKNKNVKKKATHSSAPRRQKPGHSAGESSNPVPSGLFNGPDPFGPGGPFGEPLSMDGIFGAGSPMMGGFPGSIDMGFLNMAMGSFTNLTDEEKAWFKANDPLAALTIAVSETDGSDEACSETIIRHWPAAKAALAKMGKPSMTSIKIFGPDGKENRELAMGFYNCLSDMSMYLNNARKYDAFISISQDMLELFDFSQDELTRNNLYSDMIDAYESLGQHQKTVDFLDQYWDTLKNPYLAGRISSTLLFHNHVELAERLLTPYANSNDDMVQDALRELQLRKSGKH